MHDFIRQSFLLSGERLSVLQFILISIWQYLHVLLSYLLNWWDFVLVLLNWQHPSALKNFSALVLPAAYTPQLGTLREPDLQRFVNSHVSVGLFISSRCKKRVGFIEWKHINISASADYIFWLFGINLLGSCFDITWSRLQRQIKCFLYCLYLISLVPGLFSLTLITLV